MLVNIVIIVNNNFTIGVGDGGQRGHVPPPPPPPLKFGKIYFSGNYYVKFGHFSGKKIT